MYKPFEYYAVVLSEEWTKNLLAEFSYLGFDPSRTFAHHMTILHRSRPNAELQDWAEKHLGELYHLKAIKLGVSDKAVALEVFSHVPCANARPHITLATKGSGKPVDSNYITEWVPIEPFEIQGSVTRF